MASFIGLNVGGKIYQTSRETLTRYEDCFFSLLLSGKIPSAMDAQGNYLIDRDGKIFRHILNFLRTEKLILPEGFNELHLIECEADFYQITALQEQVQCLLETTASAAEYIGFNIGGKIFQTTRETLTRDPDSLFCDMLSGQVSIPRDDYGNLFLDRDGSVFHHILNFLRHDNLISVLPGDNLRLLVCEAEYFRLPALRDHITSLIYADDDPSFFYLFCSDKHYTAYSKNEKVIEAFTFLPNYRDYITTIYREVKQIAFSLEELPTSSGRNTYTWSDHYQRQVVCPIDEFGVKQILFTSPHRFRIGYGIEVSKTCHKYKIDFL